MKVISHSQSNKDGLIKLKNNDYLKKQRIAGKCVAECLNYLENEVKNKTSLTMKELSYKTEQIIEKHNCIATFKNYKSFPESVCISVNRVLVHGIPDDYILQDGDVVSFDLGATYEGAIADSAITCIFGTPKSEQHVKGIEITNKCLLNAINSIKVGKQLGVIGNVIFKTAKNNNFNVIEQYGGHFICITDNNVGIPHAMPFISNKSNSNEGIRFQPGMTFAIEPLLVPLSCSTKTKTGNDGWSVYTDGIGFHVEKTIYIQEDNIEIIT